MSKMINIWKLKKDWISFEVGSQSIKWNIGEISELVSDACETALEKVGL